MPVQCAVWTSHVTVQVLYLEKTDQTSVYGQPLVLSCALCCPWGGSFESGWQGPQRAAVPSTWHEATAHKYRERASLTSSCFLYR